MAKNKENLSPEQQLEDYLKDHKDDHYNFDNNTEDYRISSGSLMMDIELSGGIGPGIVRSTGCSEAGKTHNAFAFMKNFLEKGEGFRGIYIKSEGRLDEKVAKRVGINFVNYKDWKDGTCFVFSSNIFETVIGLIRKLVKNNPNNIKYFFVIDSMNALLPKGDEEKPFEESMKVAGGALLSSDFLRRMSLALHERGHICFMINQVRSDIKINPYAKSDPKLTNASGGNSLNHFPDWIFEFQATQSKAKSIIDKDKIIGHYCSIILRKTTNENTGTTVTYPIKRGRVGGTSVWLEYEVADLLLSWGMVKKAGAWFKFTDDEHQELLKIDPNTPEQLQGLDKLRTFLEENPKITQYYYTKFKNTLAKDVL